MGTSIRKRPSNVDSADASVPASRTITNGTGLPDSESRTVPVTTAVSACAARELADAGSARKAASRRIATHRAPRTGPAGR